MIYETDNENDTFEKDWENQKDKDSLYGNSIVATEDFAVLLMDLNKIQKKAFCKTGVPHIILSKSENVTENDIDLSLEKLNLVITHYQELSSILFVVSFFAYKTLQPLKMKSSKINNFVSKPEMTCVHSALEGVPDCLCTNTKYDVGLIKDNMPVVVVPKSDYPQYPLQPDAEDGMTPITELLKEGIIVPASSSLCNTPLYPIKKADGKSW